MIDLNKKNFLIIVCVTFLPFNIFAAGTSVASVKSFATSSGFLSKISLAASLEYSQQIAEDEKAKRAEEMGFVLTPGYQINDTFALGAKTAFTKQNKESQETQSSDTLIALAIKGISLSSTLETLHSISGVLPTSEKSLNQNRLRGAIGISSGLHYTGTIIDLKYRLGLTQFFHEYNLNAEGSPNTQRSLSNSLELKISLSDKFYLSSLTIYRWGQTYKKKERSSFEIHGDINYDLSKKMTLNLGTSNAGNALKSDGTESNIAAFDENSSVIRAGVSISL